MASAHLDLCFPDWQPAGAAPSLQTGVLLLRDALAGSTALAEVPVEPAAPLTPAHGILGYAPIARQLRAARALVEARAPATTFLIGGTCGAEVVPVSYLNARYQGALTVIWFDAHGDLNTPRSSPSRHFHGMPLRTLLGDGAPGLAEIVARPLEPSQVILAGVRALDPPEAAYVQQHGVTHVHPTDLTTADQLVDAVRRKGHPHVYLHVDVDVLDPASFSHLYLSVPGGLPLDALTQTIETLHRAFTVVGSSLVEFYPRDDTALRHVLPLVQAIRGAR
ncbi:MAG: arginase family protein [Bacteroidota bacterium]